MCPRWREVWRYLYDTVVSAAVHERRRVTALLVGSSLPVGNTVGALQGTGYWLAPDSDHAVERSVPRDLLAQSLQPLPPSSPCQALAALAVTWRQNNVRPCLHWQIMGEFTMKWTFNSSWPSPFLCGEINFWLILIFETWHTEEASSETFGKVSFNFPRPS